VTDVPIWIQTLQALATPAIALGGGIIGYRQWRTSHQKVVLDLFDRRWQVYVNLHNLAAAIEDEHRDYDGFRQRGHRSWMMTRFLFGKDVTTEVDEFWTSVESLENIERKMHLYNENSEALAELRKNNQSCKNNIRKFKCRLPDIFSPYLQMAQKSKFH
jgi:hypothetical protein